MVQPETVEIQSPNALGLKFLMGRIYQLVQLLLGKEEQIHPGENVSKGGDDTLFAKVDGVVKYSSRNGRKLVNIIPK